MEKAELSGVLVESHLDKLFSTLTKKIDDKIQALSHKLNSISSQLEEDKAIEHPNLVKET